MNIKSFTRYHITAKKAPHVVPHPQRFLVKVNKIGLAKLLLKELVHYRGNLKVILSRPCIYGVFSGPLGGFAPRQEKCVGCLRCTTQYPEFVQIHHNPELKKLGDSYFTGELVDTVTHEAENGRIPIKGQGYRGKFGGTGWDGLWTDMSEIVRPTRDGIHGREYISTAVEIGTIPPCLKWDSHHTPIGETPKTRHLPIPMLFDTPPNTLASHRILGETLSQAASDAETLAILPLAHVQALGHKGSHLIPLVTPEEVETLAALPNHHEFIELSQWDEQAFQRLRVEFPHIQILVRVDISYDAILSLYRSGVRLFHLTADYHGRGEDGLFMLEGIRNAHQALVREGCRDEVTLLGSGGIIAAEHVPKAIMCGLDAVALDTPLLVALQAHFNGECIKRTDNSFTLPSQMTLEWGTQRLKNLLGAWRDQLLEVLGAMGLREIRRLRGEVGRAIFQRDAEKDAFEGIEGYEG